jgi:aldehyde:ferredoxin oxidoreductase
MKYTYGSEEAAEFFTKDGSKLNWKPTPQVVKRFHERAILKDSYIVCDVAFPYVYNANSKDHVGDTSLESQLFSAVTGVKLTEEASYKTGDMLCTLERTIAARDGRSRKDDVLRDRYHETADAADRKYERNDLEKAKDAYYRLRGWDVGTGIPIGQTLEKHGLKDVAGELQRRGIL